jgi:hypothetical protein
MIGKYDENPVQLLYNYLNTEISDFVDNNYSVIKDNGYKDIDKIINLILINNGCKMIPNYNILQKVEPIINSEYNICFITGMLGNDITEYYDFFVFNGTKYLVVFIDYFKITEEINYDIADDDPSYKLKMAMGNSVYYDAIKKIVEVFYLTFEPMPSALLATTMATAHRWNPSIIAIHILDNFKQVDENDVSDMPLKDIRTIADGNIALQLYGIRVSV